MAGKPWFEIIEAKLDDERARQPSAKRARADRISVGLNFYPDTYVFAKRAAEERGLTMAFYCRRAIMAMVCHDLGLDWFEVMKDEVEPRVGPSGDFSRGHSRGRGYGAWIIEKVRGE